MCLTAGLIIVLDVNEKEEDVPRNMHSKLIEYLYHNNYKNCSIQLNYPISINICSDVMHCGVFVQNV